MMNWSTWLALGIAIGMLVERGLIWIGHQCDRHQQKLQERRELDEFWSER